jgi:hypothetical protein
MPLTRVPLKNEIIAAMEVAKTTTDAADYLRDQFIKVLTDAKIVNESKDIIAKVDEFVKYVHYSLASKADAWLGQLGEPSDFKNMQRNMAENVSTALDESIKDHHIKMPFKLDIAINDLSQLLRGYSSESKSLDPEVVALLDKLFNAWLAENNIVSKDGVLYQSEANGDIKTDSRGKPLIANHDHVKSLLMDSKKGLIQYFQSKGIEMEIKQHPYPAQAAAKEATAEPTAKTAEPSVATSPQESTEATPPEEPQSSIKSGA